MFCSEEKILKSGGLINCRAQLMAIDIAISVIILRVSIHRVTSLFRMLDKYLLKLIVPMSTANVSRTVAKPAVMQVMQCMTKNFPKNV